MPSSSAPDSEISTLPHSCFHCRKIIINPPPQPRVHGFRCRLPYTRREALQAAKDGCPIYKMLVKGYRFASTPEELRQLVRAVQGKADWRLPRVGVFGSQERIIYLAESLSEHPFSIRFNENGWALFACLAWGSWWFYVNARPTDPAASVFPIPPVNRNVASAEAFDWARKWLNECANHGPETHRLCPSAKDIEFTPTRLLQVALEGGRYRVRLRETLPHERLRYVCLSYCWGGDQPVKTTKATLAERARGINFQALPKTLQDAIFVTQQLQLSFIWIDCLTIIQDDKEDLAVELPKMPEIYKNAWVTISASSASTCFEGFLEQRRPSADTQCEDVALRYQCSNGTIGNIYMFQHESNTVDPIDKRAWTFQERRISPRFLDFASHQLRWKCNSRAYFDGGFAPANYEEQKTKGTHEQVKPASYNDSGDATLEQTIFKVWPEIVDNYTQRSLSFPGDKLIALAALASEIGDPLNMTYLAGLWKEHLPAQLLWRLWGEPAKRPELYRAPSWSWASVDGYIMMEHEANTDRVAIEVLGCTIEPVTKGFVYGAVESGTLTIKGRLLPAIWSINREDCLALEGVFDFDSESEGMSDLEQDLSDDEMTDIPDTPSEAEALETTSDAVEATVLEPVDLTADAIEVGWDMNDPDFAVEVHCLQVISQTTTDGSAGLLLVLSDSSNPSSYKRVGHFIFDSRKNDVFQNVDERVMTIV